jgi:pimeloyl-ACP methyl ester carboxylesterase
MVDASAGAQRTAAALEAITTADLRPRLAATHMPLGVVWGEADRTVPIRALDDLVEARPDARVVTLPNTGHVPMVERPTEFTAALQALLKDEALVPNSATNPSEVSIIVP